MKNRSMGRATAGRSAGSVSSKMTKPADGPMFSRRQAAFIFRASAGSVSFRLDPSGDSYVKQEMLVSVTLSVLRGSVVAFVSVRLQQRAQT